jgi:hypothetical protein
MTLTPKVIPALTLTCMGTSWYSGCAVAGGSTASTADDTNTAGTTATDVRCSDEDDEQVEDEASGGVLQAPEPVPRAGAPPKRTTRPAPGRKLVPAMCRGMTLAPAPPTCHHVVVAQVEFESKT